MQKLTSRLLLLLCLVFIQTMSFATVNSQQDEEEGITIRPFYGLNMGVYYAHPSTANYYNGDGIQSEHSIESALILRRFNYDRLVRDVPEIIDSFAIGELPRNMQYNPSLQVGLFGGLAFESGFSIIAEFNYTRLTVQDNFTLFTDKFTSTSEPYRLLSDVYAEEERIEVNAGFQYTIFTNGYIHPFFEAGMSIIDSEILENRVSVAGVNISIREIQTQIYDLRDYGIGFGIYSALGLELDVNENFSLKTGVSVNFARINIGNNEDINPRFTGWLRLHLEDLFGGSRERG